MQRARLSRSFALPERVLRDVRFAERNATIKFQTRAPGCAGLRRAAPGADAEEIAGSTKSQKTGIAGIASE